MRNTGFTTARNDNSISAFNTKTPNGSFGFVDIQQPSITDAMARIKMKNKFEGEQDFENLKRKAR